VPVIDHHAGENQPMQMFVAVLGASNNTFADATRSQKTARAAVCLRRRQHRTGFTIS
jgi:transposase